MATGIEMLDALKGIIEGLPADSTLPINEYDKVDLCNASANDLESRGFDRPVADRVAADLMRGSLDELAKILDIRFTVQADAKNLIFGEGFRRANRILENDPQTLEEMLLEMDQIRHPERYALKDNRRLFTRLNQYRGRIHTSRIVMAELYDWAFRFDDPAPRLESIKVLVADIKVLELDDRCARTFGELRNRLRSVGRSAGDGSVDCVHGDRSRFDAGHP